jgi:hypothetical protein
MGLSVGSRILLWVLLPIITSVVVVLAPEVAGLAVEAVEAKAEKAAKARVGKAVR